MEFVGFIGGWYAWAPSLVLTPWRSTTWHMGILAAGSLENKIQAGLEREREDAKSNS
jgi:hypothetical protein